MQAFNVKFMLILLIIMIIVTLLYSAVKDLFVSKLNKWVVLVITIALFFGTVVLSNTFKVNSGKFTVNQILYYVVMAVFLFFLNAFFDLLGWTSQRGKSKKVVIKPKAKPKRAKKK